MWDWCCARCCARRPSDCDCPQYGDYGSTAIPQSEGWGGQEQENQTFTRMLNELGAYELERRMSKLDSYRKYYRRWPFDGTAKTLNIDDISEEAVPADDLDRIIAEEAVEAAKRELSPRQVDIVVKLMEGFRPIEIALQEGRKSSNAVRWQKHAIKQKLSDPAAKEKE